MKKKHFFSYGSSQEVFTFQSCGLRDFGENFLFCPQLPNGASSRLDPYAKVALFFVENAHVKKLGGATGTPSPQVQKTTFLPFARKRKERATPFHFKKPCILNRNIWCENGVNSSNFISKPYAQLDSEKTPKCPEPNSFVP